MINWLAFFFEPWTMLVPNSNSTFSFKKKNPLNFINQLNKRISDDTLTLNQEAMSNKSASFLSSSTTNIAASSPLNLLTTSEMNSSNSTLNMNKSGVFNDSTTLLLANQNAVSASTQQLLIQQLCNDSNLLASLLRNNQQLLGAQQNSSSLLNNSISFHTLKQAQTSSRARRNSISKCED